MAEWDLLLTDARIATMRGGDGEYGTIENGAIAVADGEIAWLGPIGEIPGEKPAAAHSVGHRWLTPALIDCHTHLVFGGDRAAEFEQRQRGASYEEVAATGGGILSTVKATRAASADELFDAALPRLLALAEDGAATIEVKSGYGLDVDSEIRMLEVGRRLGDATPVDVRTTLLAAHTVPPEYRGNADAYICLLYTSPSPRDATLSRMPSSA